MPPGYLKEMPDPARVLASFGGSDDLDRTARQKAAFIVLRDMIGELSDGRVYRHQLTADEQRIYKSYEDAWGLVPTPHFDEAESRRLGWASPSGKWTKLQQDLRLDTAFRNELLDRFFSPAWKSSFLAVEARQDQKVRDFKRRQEQLASGRQVTAQPLATYQQQWWRYDPGKKEMTKLVAVVLIAVGIWIIWATAKFKVKLDKYEFENRSGDGVVGFKTYEDSVAHKSKQSLTGYGFGCGFLLVLIAIFMLTLWKLM